MDSLNLAKSVNQEVQAINLLDEIKESLLKDYPFLANWVVSFDYARRRAGVCRLNEKRISISIHHINKNPEAIYKDTILHEYAHAIAYELYKETGHGLKWKSIAKKIGAKPKATGHFEVAEAPWVLVYYESNSGHIEKIANRFRRNKKIKHYGLKGRPETQGRLYYVDYKLFRHCEDLAIPLSPKMLTQ